MFFPPLLPSSLVPTVAITVTRRTDPPGFVPGDPTQYRAASGPQEFTCTATGGAGSGDYDYVWTSTCSRGCAFQRMTTGTTSVITRGALHSGDIGTHTCTATRGGVSGSDSITLNVVGEWQLLHWYKQPETHIALVVIKYIYYCFNCKLSFAQMIIW